MECIALIIVAVIIFLDLLHERECKKIYKENLTKDILERLGFTIFFPFFIFIKSPRISRI